MTKRRGHSFKHLLVRHYCDSCGGRVFPFDSFETRTESPEHGARNVDQFPLLKSWNAAHKTDRRAWCFAEEKWVKANRLVEDEIRSLYNDRKGVYLRGQQRTNGVKRAKAS